MHFTTCIDFLFSAPDHSYHFAGTVRIRSIQPKVGIFIFREIPENSKIFETFNPVSEKIGRTGDSRIEQNGTVSITNKTLKRFFDAVSCSQQCEHWSMIFKTAYDSCHWHQETPGKTVWHGLRTEVDSPSIYQVSTEEMIFAVHHARSTRTWSSIS